MGLFIGDVSRSSSQEDICVCGLSFFFFFFSLSSMDFPQIVKQGSGIPGTVKAVLSPKGKFARSEIHENVHTKDSGECR